MKWIVGVSLFAVIVFAGFTLTIPAQTIVPDQGVLRLLPAETQGVAFIDVANLRIVPLVQDLIAQGSLPATPPERLQEFVAATGLDFQHDVDRVTIGRLGVREMLAIVEARYDKFKVEQYINDKGIQSEAHMGRTVYRFGDDGGLSFVDNLIIAGKLDSVKKAIEQMSLPGNIALNADL